jgi:isoamylase
VEQERFTARLIDFRGRFPVLFDNMGWWADRVQWFGVEGSPDTGAESRSIAWSVGGLYVMANMWWEPLTFAVQAPGVWSRAIDTSVDVGFVEGLAGHHVEVAPRSIVVLVSHT